MFRRAFSMAILLGIATCAGAAEVRAMPRLGATITIQDDRAIQVTGKRGWGHRGFDRGHGFHRGHGVHRGFARDHHGFAPDHHGFGRRHHDFGRHKSFKRHHGFARHHDGYRYRGYSRHDVFVARRIGKGQFVIIRPAYGPWFQRRYVAPRPLIKNGSFARRPYW